MLKEHACEVTVADGGRKKTGWSRALQGGSVQCLSGARWKHARKEEKLEQVRATARGVCCH